MSLLEEIEKIIAAFEEKVESVEHPVSLDNSIVRVLAELKCMVAILKGEHFPRPRFQSEGCGTVERLLEVYSDDIPPDLKVPLMDQPPGEVPPESY